MPPRRPTLTLAALMLRQLAPLAGRRIGGVAAALVAVVGIFGQVLQHSAHTLRATLAHADAPLRAQISVALVASWALLWAPALRALLRDPGWRPLRRAPLTDARLGALALPWLMVCASPAAAFAGLHSSAALPRAALWLWAAPLLLAGLASATRRPGAAWIAALTGVALVGMGELGALWASSGALGAMLVAPALAGRAHRQLDAPEQASGGADTIWPARATLALARRDLLILWRVEPGALRAALAAQLLLGGLVWGIAWNNPDAPIVGPIRAATLAGLTLGALASAGALARLMARLGRHFGPGRLPISAGQRAGATWLVLAALLWPGAALGLIGAHGQAGWMAWADSVGAAALHAALISRLIAATSQRHAELARAATPAALVAATLAVWALPYGLGALGALMGAGLLVWGAARGIEAVGQER